MRERLFSAEKGQSLLEAALLLPVLLTIVFNAVNLGYFAYVFLNLSSASRQGAEYSIQGPQSNLSLSPLPGANRVGALIADGFTGAIKSVTTDNTSIRVCTPAIGLSQVGTSAQVPLCSTVYGSGSFPAPGTNDADPEAPFLVLNRIDIQYTVTPLIPGGAFNIMLPPSLTFNRTVYMRVME
jgi:hypothetical protein